MHKILPQSQMMSSMLCVVSYTPVSLSTQQPRPLMPCTHRARNPGLTQLNTAPSRLSSLVPPGVPCYYTAAPLVITRANPFLAPLSLNLLPSTLSAIDRLAATLIFSRFFTPDSCALPERAGRNFGSTSTGQAEESLHPLACLAP